MRSSQGTASITMCSDVPSVRDVVHGRMLKQTPIISGRQPELRIASVKAVHRSREEAGLDIFLEMNFVSCIAQLMQLPVYRCAEPIQTLYFFNTSIMTRLLDLLGLDLDAGHGAKNGVVRQLRYPISSAPSRTSEASSSDESAPAGIPNFLATVLGHLTR